MERRAHDLDGCWFTSNHGPRLDALWLGTRVWSTVIGGLYERAGGTSFAAPFVGGSVALLLSNVGEGSLLTGEVEGLVKASCWDIKSDRDGGSDLHGWDEWSGWGSVRIDSAIFDFTEGPYEIKHWCETGGYVSWIGPSEVAIFFGEGPVPINTWFWTKIHEVRRDVNWGNQFDAFHSVWGLSYGSSSTGWAPWIPNYQIPDCSVVQGTVTSTGCTLVSYVFELWSWPMPETYYGFWPSRPEDVTFCCMLLGGPQASVPSEGAEFGHGESVMTVYPNPGTGETMVSLQIVSSGWLHMSIYDARGKHIRKLHAGRVETGIHRFGWNGENDDGAEVPSGVYFCHARTPDVTLTKKLVVSR